MAVVVAWVVVVVAVGAVAGRCGVARWVGVVAPVVVHDGGHVVAELVHPVLDLRVIS